jgi:hypothetical protein
MSKLIQLLNAVPLASVLTLVVVIGGLYALLTGQITYIEFATGVAAVSAGSGVLGIARNKAGHGVK